MRAVFTHAFAVGAGVAIAANSIALLDGLRRARRRTPTWRESQRSFYKMSLSAKVPSNTTYHGFWTERRLHDSARIAQ